MFTRDRLRAGDFQNADFRALLEGRRAALFLFARSLGLRAKLGLSLKACAGNCRFWLQETYERKIRLHASFYSSLQTDILEFGSSKSRLVRNTPHPLLVGETRDSCFVFMSSCCVQVLWKQLRRPCKYRGDVLLLSCQYANEIVAFRAALAFQNLCGEKDFLECVRKSSELFLGSEKDDLQALAVGIRVATSCVHSAAFDRRIELQVSGMRRGVPASELFVKDSRASKSPADREASQSRLAFSFLFSEKNQSLRGAPPEDGLLELSEKGEFLSESFSAFPADSLLQPASLAGVASASEDNASALQRQGVRRGPTGDGRVGKIEEPFALQGETTAAASGVMGDPHQMKQWHLHSFFGNFTVAADQAWLSLETADRASPRSSRQRRETALYCERAEETRVPSVCPSGSSLPPVVIAVLDTGCYLHQDFIDGFNISSSVFWVNNEEEDCRDGVDDDGNGYVDDCFGWVSEGTP